ncbi:MAG: hypothetical protein H0U76_10455, partial [Ktedonobacteraceae bacterium]|nr:hypothetical protein [Ktedonobacteraceae bacterium]
IILSTGSFILLTLLALLLAIPASPGRASIAGQPANTPRQFLASAALVLALIALFGKIVTDRAARAVDTTYAANSWFASLAHLALAAIAGVELLLQLASSNQIRLLPFNTVLYAGFNLNTVALLLLGAIAAFSLISFRSALTWLDGLILLLLGATCALFQYTFGAAELARLSPTLNPGLIGNINVVLSIAPLVLAALAVFTEWARFVAPLWLSIQLLILQQFVGSTQAAARAGSVIQTPQFGQIILYILAAALVLLALRLLLYWDRRDFNGIDGITVTLIALIVGFTSWSLGQSNLLQARTGLTAGSLTLLVYVLAICALLALALLCVHTFFSYSNIWLSRTESIIGILFTISIAVGALLLLNTPGYQGSYVIASTLNPHALNPVLPRILIRNQYILDGLFVLLLLLYVLALVRQRWNRRFMHIERTLLILSGFACLLVLAGTGENSALPLVVANMQRLAAYGQTTFRVETIAATGILIVALISLLWLFRSRNRADRIVLAVLSGLAILCICIYYFRASSFFLLCSLPLLTAETLIAAKIERVQAGTQELKAENGNEIVASSAP